MHQDAINLTADLIAGKDKVPVDVTYASRYSLLVRYSDSRVYGDGARFSNLVIHVNGEECELGPCRVMSEPNIDGYAGRLVFLEDVYDLEKLFLNNRIVKLQSAFVNLPLVLAYKQRICSAFKEYTANLTYDLSVYKGIFDSLDLELSVEPESIRESVRGAIIDTEGKKFMRFLDERLEELGSIVGSFNREEHAQHGFYFRKQLWNYILCSPLLKRTNLKPRGYVGDSVMMQMIYANELQGDSTFSKLMHKHPLEHSAAQAVRSRRHIIANMARRIREYDTVMTDGRLKVLSVACGPAIEIEDILVTARDCERYHFALLDQDRQALFEAAEFINQIEKRLEAKIKVDYLNESVRTMLASPQLKGRWGEFDFIYSMGLFDYLTPRVASAVLRRLFQLLKPEGEIIAGNFHTSNPSKYYMEYWADWVLYHRTEEEFGDLLGNAASAEINIFFDDTASQMFLHIRKTGER
jgi:extracellular factor (EF) 3-hydroxypalmitic acid methyl ester biosynthesis protein